MENTLCPICGSEALEKRSVSEIIKEPFGGQKTIETSVCYCNACESIFDEDEDIKELTIKELKHNSIVNIVNAFSENKISMSAIERALELPQRTIAKWKSGDSQPSAAGISLLRFIRIFPWLLEVAESKYDYNKAQKIYIKSAIEKLLESHTFNDQEFKKAAKKKGYHRS